MDGPSSVVMTAGDAAQLQAEHYTLGNLLVWVVYAGPGDFPGCMVARPWSVRPHGPLGFVLVADTLEGLREQLPPGTINIARSDGDDPVILETWI